MRVGSLFSGIGGLDLGLERAGMEIVWQCEVDPFCQEVLKRHWPGLPLYEDVRDLNIFAPSVDVLCGGFPCQPVSTAGAKRGRSDERWLWPEFRRVVALLRPRWVVAENVIGLRTRGLSDVVEDLTSLGYDTEWNPVSAAAFGAPHLRDRIFVVAYAAGERSSPAVFLGEQESMGHAPDKSWWTAEPDVGRVADGVPARVDRLRALGNAVVPQVAEWVGRRIMELESSVY